MLMFLHVLHHMHDGEVSLRVTGWPCCCDQIALIATSFPSPCAPQEHLEVIGLGWPTSLGCLWRLQEVATRTGSQWSLSGGKWLLRVLGHSGV